MKTRKNLPKTALPRIYRIDEMIASGKYPNTKEIAKAYETSISSISRDIDFMKNSLGAPIEYDAYRRGYYYSEATFRLPGSFTSTENVQALGITKTLLSFYQNSPLYETVKTLLDTITAPVEDLDNSDFFENRIAVLPLPVIHIDTNIWNIVLTGLKENKIITFKYRGTYDDDFMPRKVRPYQLLFDSGLWYLYAYAEERKAIRIFSLSRMKNAVITKEGFSLPKNYSYIAQTDGSKFGVFAGGEKHRFVIHFYDESTLLITERQWATDQVIEETEYGVTITFTSTQYHKVLEWILSQGCFVKPIEPKELVKDWKWHIKEMQKLSKSL